MRRVEVAWMLAAGTLIWIAGTIYYAYRGRAVLESTQLRYWIAFSISPIFSALLCIAIFKWRHIPPAAWASAALLIAIPGMIGESLVLSHLSTFMPRIQESSGGRYGAFLFAAYALVLGVAEIVTLAARP